LEVLGGGVLPTTLCEAASFTGVESEVVWAVPARRVVPVLAALRWRCGRVRTFVVTVTAGEVIVCVTAGAALWPTAAA
jgi:hypothetical protein